MDNACIGIFFPTMSKHDSVFVSTKGRKMKWPFAIVLFGETYFYSPRFFAINKPASSLFIATMHARLISFKHCYKVEMLNKTYCPCVIAQLLIFVYTFSLSEHRKLSCVVFEIMCAFRTLNYMNVSSVGRRRESVFLQHS